MRKQKKQKSASSAGREKTCKHQWAPLLAKYKKEIIPVASAKICLKCGILKIGTKTIKISRFRLDMGNLPIQNALKVVINNTGGRLKIPVGTNLYD